MVFVVGGWIYSNLVSVPNEGRQLENTLNAAYNNTQIELGNCLDKSAQAAGVAEGLTRAQAEILTKAVTGRYRDANGNSTSADGALGRGAYFSAIQEAYPDLKDTGKAFQDVMVIVTSCRDAYNNQQKNLQVMIASYSNWKDVRTPADMWGKSGFPSNTLRAAPPGYDGEVLTGESALTRMRSVIVVKGAGKAYDTGVLDDQKPFGS